MKKMNTSPISGMQELTPGKQATFDKLKNEIDRVYHSHGFLSVETPTIERNEILLAKAGGDTEKQIYKVFKTAETTDDADQALRFDHTVPLARYVVEHENDLTFPFKVTQIGKNFRGERAQKGRFREFYQLDVDVIGRNELSLAYDVEVVKTAYDALKTFIKPEMKIRISNRKILSGLLQELGLVTKSEDIFSIVDHAEKVPKEKTISAFEEIGMSVAEIEKLTTFMEINGLREEVIESLKDLGIENETYKLGVDELEKVLDFLEKQGMKDVVVGDMLIVRGLDYYTGSVFETFLPEYREIGSICSGGRYENLAGNYTDQKFPGVGISIGLTRLFYILNENNLLDSAEEKPLDLVLIPFSEKEYEYTFKLAENLRESGKKVDINLTDKKVGDKFTYAAKIAKFASVIGENEVSTGNIEVKNLETGEKIKLEDYIR
ncbi:histidine--tRNA ligase [Candidatus Saccharibacteria bacterium]|nr:histidine--tRNA ligase [Candidatus Saccharibacteria bacterium]